MNGKHKPIVAIRIKNPKLNQLFVDNAKNLSFMQIYDRKMQLIQKRVNRINNENTEFYKSYSLSKTYLKYKDPFEDIKEAYNEKGYKIPNLSESHNLFKPTPLLMEKKDIDMYFKNNALLSYKSEKILRQTFITADKSRKYLTNLKKEVQNKQNEKKTLSKTFMIMNTKSRMDLKKQDEEIGENDMQRMEMFEKIKEKGKYLKHKKENKELCDYNNRINRLIPHVIYTDREIESENKKTLCKKVFFNILNNFDNNNQNDDTLSSDRSLPSTKPNTFRCEAKKKISKHLTIVRSKLKCQKLPSLNKTSIYYDNKPIADFLNKEKVDRSDLIELDNQVRLDRLEFPVIKSILEKYFEFVDDKKEKNLLIDILENGDPNGLVNIIQQFKKHINGLEINGKIEEYKKKDKRFLNFKLINKKANRLDKQLIQKMYYHANVDECIVLLNINI